MSSKSETGRSGAEKAFRDAFERLKNGQPTRLAKGTKVSQNNVAKEAGCDPSALKKARYPSLIEEIQAWLRDQPKSAPASSRQKLIGQRNKNLVLRDRIAQLTLERDHSASLLVEADAKILELVRKVSRLEAMLPANVVNFSAKRVAGETDGLANLGTCSTEEDGRFSR